MDLVATFDIYCEQLPLVGVAATVPESTLRLKLQFTHGPRPVFVVTVTGGTPTTVDTALAEAADVKSHTLVGQAGETLRYQALPAFSLAEQLGEQLDLEGLSHMGPNEDPDRVVEVIRAFCTEIETLDSTV